MSQPVIGFIGLGLMGLPMAERLQDKGYQLIVLGNKNRSGIDVAVGRGATEVTNGRELAEQADIVMLCMSTSEQVEARMAGDDGIIAGLSAGKTVVDFGTSLPESTRKLAKQVSSLGAGYLDAPLGRTPAHARDGMLNIMCAGDEKFFAGAEPVLKDLGENVFYLGASGAGHTVKLINNAFGMTIANAMAEGFVLADAAGVSRKTVYDVIAAGPLHSGMMDFVSAYALENDSSKLEFSIANACKDVGYFFDTATALGMEPMIAAGPLGALREAVDEGRGESMVSEMVDFYSARGKKQDI